MNRTSLFQVARSLMAAASFITLGSAYANAQTEIVLHTKDATRVNGAWQHVSDTTAASGSRLWNPDRGAGKLSTAFASPTDYFELTFNAEAYQPYRIWLRGKADNNVWTNDSVFVQFSSSLDYYARAINRIGTTSAMVVSVEACSGCGLSGWGWEDNGYDGAGQYIHFATTGPQTIRIQRREDGMSIDQVVLSRASYYSTSPGKTKGDTTILAATTTGSAPVPDPEPPPDPESPTSIPEIVLTSAHATGSSGNWRSVADATAAEGSRYWLPDAGKGKLSNALAAPADYVDFTFTAEAGKPYRLYMRGKADADFYANDSAFVQFSGAVTATGSATMRIGTTSSTVVSIENCSGCGLAGWGWSDNGYGGWGDLIYFATTGPQTLRVQRREDGLSFDQIVLSTTKYLWTLPGKTKQDTTILTGTTAPTDPTEPTEPTEPTAPPPPPPPPPSGPVRLRVLHWNIHHSAGTDGIVNIDRIATAMANANPDIVTINEAEKYNGWGNEDQPLRYKQLLQQKTGRTWYMHFSQEFGQWSSNGKGHVILSVYPFDSVGHTTTTPSSGLKWAGAISQATITVNYRTINLFVAHLDPYDQAMRLTQAKEVINWASGFAENRILTGDMNAWPDQSSILELNKYYNDSWTVALSKGTASASTSITPYGATKNGRIDYIFYSKGASDLTVIDSRVYDLRDGSGIMPSDHRPVVTTFEVR